MKKLLLAIGVLSAGVAFGQTTTKMKSTTTSSSDYNNTNTNNYNSQNATSGTNSSTNRPTSTTGSYSNSGSGMNSGSTMGTGTSGTSGMGSSTGTYSNTMSTGNTNYNTGTGTGTSSGTYSTTSGTGSYNSGMGTSATTPSTTNGSYNTNSMGTGTSATTPSTNGSYNTNNMGTSTVGTSTSTYSTETTATRPDRTKDYKNFAYGIYVGANTTKFKGESFDANGNAEGLTGRLGYQAGFFVRGGGRLFGQIGAEYFASSSNYFTAGNGTGQSAASIRDQINIKYIQVPVYLGYKLTESDRGISSVRVQVGVEYANQIGSTAGQFGNLNDFQVKGGTFNGLGQLGFDAGPLFLDLTYHYGFSDAIQRNTGFASSQRRILSASLGFKF